MNTNGHKERNCGTKPFAAKKGLAPQRRDGRRWGGERTADSADDTDGVSAKRSQWGRDFRLEISDFRRETTNGHEWTRMGTNGHEWARMGTKREIAERSHLRRRRDWHRRGGTGAENGGERPADSADDTDGVSAKRSQLGSGISDWRFQISEGKPRMDTNGVAKAVGWTRDNGRLPTEAGDFAKRSQFGSRIRDSRFQREPNRQGQWPNVDGEGILPNEPI